MLKFRVWGPPPLQALELVYCVLKALCHPPADGLTRYRSKISCVNFNPLFLFWSRLGFVSAFCATAKDMKVEKDHFEEICLPSHLCFRSVLVAKAFGD